MKIRWTCALPVVPVAAVMGGVAAYDLTQKKHALLRNFPVVGHLRYVLESIGRSCGSTSSAATTRSDLLAATNAGGSMHRRRCRTTTSASAPTATWSTGRATPVVKHRTFAKIAPHAGSIVMRTPSYRARRSSAARATAPRHSGRNSVVNISGMSFGALSGAAIEALNCGAAAAGCLHNTGEGGLSPHHLHGADLKLASLQDPAF